MRVVAQEKPFCLLPSPLHEARRIISAINFPDASAATLRRPATTPPPRVSVILPSYNHAAFVEQAVESVLSQSFTDLELIITDDGSTDGTADRIRSICDPRISLEALPVNRGYSAALNASIARARGELIALHCSDDVFLPGKLERQVGFLDANPGVAAVFGKPVFVDKDGGRHSSRSHPFDGIFIDDLPDRFAWLRHFFLQGNGLCHPTALLRRAVYDEVGRYDPLLVQLQDYDFWIRVSSRHELKVLDEPLVAYRVLGEGLNTSWPSAAATRRTAWETRRVLRQYLNFDAALIGRVFSADFAELGLATDLPPRTALGLLLAARRGDPARQAFALELLEAAVAAGDPGITHSMFSRLAGELNPYNLHGMETEQQAASHIQQALERCRTAELRADAADALAHKVTSSTTWRATAPLRRFLENRPALLRAVRQALGVVRGSASAAVVPVRDVHEETRTEILSRATRLSGAVDGYEGGFERSPKPLAAIEAAGQLAPPLVAPGMRRTISAPVVQSPVEWENVPAGWRSDDPRGTGWEHPSIIEVQQRKWPEFIQAVQGTNPLGIYHEAAQIDSENPAAHNFVLAFAYVLARAAAGQRTLSILDWGGGLGHYAVIARATLPEVSLEYTVFDLPDICAAGRSLLPNVRFTSDVEECLSRRYDLILASGSLQYVHDWQKLLKRFAGSAERWVFLTRTPFVDKSAAFVVVQRPHSAGGYQTEYLSHVFNRPELLAEAAAAGLTLEREFLMVGERVAAVGAPEPFEYRGFLLQPARPHIQ